jgi:hypothetical protein
MSNEILLAYNEAISFIQDKGLDVSIISHESVPDHVTDKIKKSIPPSFNFWSNLLKEEMSLIVISSTEKSYDWLRERLIEHDFLPAMPKKDRINTVGNVGVTGGGGTIIKNNKNTLFFWQVVGTKSKFDGTGELKTPPHLFAHAAQGYIFNTETLSMTDLPQWFIEGQSDYSALCSISNNFEDFVRHREQFYTVAFVPGIDTRKRLSLLDSDGWYKSLSEAQIPFDGIPVIDEYYSGFFCYEKLLNMVGFAGIKNITNKVIDGQDFNSAFYQETKKTVSEFHKIISVDLANLSRQIVAF